MPGRLLSCYPKAAIGAGVLESLVTHNDKEVHKRLLKLIRVLVSFSASRSFCIDMNSFEFEKSGTSEGEVLFLQKPDSISFCPTFTPQDKAALQYVQQITATPISLIKATFKELKNHFFPRTMVIIACTATQENFWIRLIQGLGIAPAGNHELCNILNLYKYSTLKKESL